MMNWKRWLKAQRYERKYWGRISKYINSGSSSQLNWYSWKAREMERQLEDILNSEKKKSSTIIEIGSGPIGIVSFLQWGERYALDPLEDYYIKNNTLIERRSPRVKYIKGIGENIPFDNEWFSLAIIDNVIDHTENPQMVFQEVYRILKNDGLMYLCVNIHTTWGAFIHKLLANLNIDKGHPHTFSKENIRSMINKNRFKIEKEEIEDYLQIKIRNCNSESVKDKLKGYSGQSEFQYHAICKKC